MCCASSRLGTGRAVTRHGSHTQPRQGVPACRPFCSVQTVDSAAGRPQYRGEGPSPAVGNGMSQEPAEAPSEGQVMRAQWQRLGTGEGQRAFSVGQADQGTQASKATTDPQLLSSRLQEGYCSALARAPAQAEKTLGHRSTRHALVRQGAGAQRKGHGGWEMGCRQLGPRVLQEAQQQEGKCSSRKTHGVLLWSARELCWRLAELGQRPWGHRAEV